MIRRLHPSSFALNLQLALIVTLCVLRGTTTTTGPQDPAISSLHDKNTVYLTPSTLPKDLVVPIYNRPLQPFRNGETLFYQASWLGISAATVRISFTQDISGTSWIGQMWLTTNRFTDLLYRMRDYAREDISVSSLRPAKIY